MLLSIEYMNCTMSVNRFTMRSHVLAIMNVSLAVYGQYGNNLKTYNVKMIAKITKNSKS